MAANGIFAMACPDCGGPLEPAPEPEEIARGLHACTSCGRRFLVHLGYAIAVDSPTDCNAA